MGVQTTGRRLGVHGQVVPRAGSQRCQGYDPNARRAEAQTGDCSSDPAWQEACHGWRGYAHEKRWQRRAGGRVLREWVRCMSSITDDTTATSSKGGLKATEWANMLTWLL